MQTTFFIYSKRLLYIALLLWQATALAQAPDITWQKSFGGDTADYASAIRQTTDGGYIIAGSSNSNNGDVTGNHGNYDYWIVKLDADATLTWQKSLGGSYYDEATSIQQTTDGGYIVVGYSDSYDGDVTGNHGGWDIWIVKLDSNGTIAWQKCLGGSGWDYATSIQQCTDGGYIVAGYSSSNDGDVTGNHGYADYWVVKLATNGNLSWQKCLGGSGTDWAYSIQQTKDGGYIVAGESNSIDGDVTGNHGYADYWIVKLDTNGNLSWQKSLGGSEDDIAYSIQQTSDGGYIVAGKIGSIDGDIAGYYGGTDAWIVKLAANGNLAWQKCLGGSGYDEANAIQQTTEGGYIVAGRSFSIGNHGLGDYSIVKLDASGNLAWQKDMGGSYYDGAYSIQQTTDGGYIVAGFSGSTNGDVTENHGFSDYWIVKLGGFGVGIDEASAARGLNLSPNPAQNILNIESDVAKEIVVLNMLGESVMAMHVVGNEGFDVSGLHSGIYWVRDVSSGSAVKFVKE